MRCKILKSSSRPKFWICVLNLDLLSLKYQASAPQLKPEGDYIHDMLLLCLQVLEEYVLNYNLHRFGKVDIPDLWNLKD